MSVDIKLICQAHCQARMSLDQGYGVLKGQAVDRKLEREDRQSPHFQVWLKANRGHYRLAINVRSVRVPFNLLYLIDDDFNHPITSQLIHLEPGFTKIPIADRRAGGIALDYIRSNLFNVRAMKPMPANVPGPANDLHDLLDVYIQRSLNNPSVDVYGFGEPWGLETKQKTKQDSKQDNKKQDNKQDSKQDNKQDSQRDTVFHFRPSRGIHNIHMNQGSKPPFHQENGVYQDGGLLIHFRDRSQWVAAFFAFQSQSFHTNDRTGNPIHSG